MDKILVIGAGGQLGTELVEELRARLGVNNVVSSDVRSLADESAGPFERLDVLDKEGLGRILDKYKITQIYHLAAILSANGEKNPLFAWRLNMESLLNVLEAAREKNLNKVYWPSSIAVFGPTTPAQNTPQRTVMEPNTVYGISKQAGEQWCQYYFQKFGVDVRSIRYPGLIGYKALPGGGTTDYAVDIYHQALKQGKYECFLREDSYLPMMYMPDAVRGTLELMDAPAEQIAVRTSYNLNGISFSPKEITESIQKHLPDFSISYAPDFRQAIADSWPDSIADDQAAKDWGWKPAYDLDRMTEDMLTNLK